MKFQIKQLISLSCAILLSTIISAQQPTEFKPQWKHQYQNTLVMKMVVSVPDNKGGTIVYTDFDQVLSLIKEVDQLSLNAPKIIYLVGCFYNGHDDKYPAFFEVNPALKRPTDANAAASLNWLMKEAKKYNTTVSVHINMTEAYENSPLWKSYVDNDLLSKNADGSLMVVGNYNGKNAYQINYKKEWEKGYAQDRIDKLIAYLPALVDAGTIHIDAWIARENKFEFESVVTEAEYQKKIAKYFINKGIDPSSEWVMDYMVGLIPHYWHTNFRTQQDYITYPASVLTGTHMNPDLRKSDFGLEFLFGTSVYGETVFPTAKNNIGRDEWQKLFQREFCLNFLQYYYLNQHKRIGVTGQNNKRTAHYAGEIRVSLQDSTVIEKDKILRIGNVVCFPAGWRNDNSIVAYSPFKTEISYQVPSSWGAITKATMYHITKAGLIKPKTISIRKNKIFIPLQADTPVTIIP